MSLRRRDSWVPDCRRDGPSHNDRGEGRPLCQNDRGEGRPDLLLEEGFECRESTTPGVSFGHGTWSLKGNQNLRSREWCWAGLNLGFISMSSHLEERKTNQNCHSL